MTNDQITAWQNATGWAGAVPGDLKGLIVGIVVALVMLWAGYIVFKLGNELATDDIGQGWLRFVLYLGRALLVVVLTVWLVVS